jgi:hypothetical protein
MDTKKDVKYTFTFWAKSGDANSHLIHVAATGDSASEYTYRNGTSFTLSSEWQQCQHPYTWTDNTTTKKHFRLFLAGSTGIVCFDSMALDTGELPVSVKAPLTVSYNSLAVGYACKLNADGIQIDMSNPLLAAANVAIYSLQGRLVSTRTVPAAVSSFKIPRPEAGAWVVDVNSSRRLIQVP